MSTLGNTLLSAHAIYVCLIVFSFFIILLTEDDELHQYAINKAMKTSFVITILSLLGYAFYNLVLGIGTISIHVLFFGVEALSLLTLLLYYLELKGFSFSLKIKNKIVKNIINTLSISISAFATISMIFKFKLFANPSGFIRYDELILLINFAFLSLVLPLFPNIKLKLNREAYKKQEKELKKTANIFTAIFILCMIVLIAYTIYHKVIS